jgi:hypothetical protein
VDRNGKHSVGRAERLLDPVAVVDVDVHHSIAPLKKLKNAEDAAKTGGLALFAQRRQPRVDHNVCARKNGRTSSELVGTLTVHLCRLRRHGSLRHGMREETAARK